MVTKTIICLANSRKHGGNCIAGKEQAGGAVADWIRPISSRAGREVSPTEQKYQNNTYPTVLDIIAVTLKHPTPSGCHTEDWLLNPGYWWVKKGSVDWHQTVALADTPAQLWINGDCTVANLNDQMAVAIIAPLTSSICMVHVLDLEIHVISHYQKTRVQARFNYRNVNYWLWITDPVFENLYSKRGLGEYKIGECCLTISLSEPQVKPSDGLLYAYKLVAAIILSPV